MLGMGLPVITNSGVGDVDRIIEDTQSGILVETFSQASYEKAADRITELLNIPVSQLQDAAHRYYSLELGVKRYAQIYQSLTAFNDGISRS
jgi:glycosyltransferase involved in cell wall biosynthesis